MSLLSRSAAFFNALKTKLSVPGQSSVFNVPAKMAGVKLTHENALNYSAVWACVNAISKPISVIPWRVYRRIDSKGKKLAEGRPEDWMLYRKPNIETNSVNFKRALVTSALLWGNGYAEIERNGKNMPVGLWLMEPERVMPNRTTDGDLVYEINNHSGPKTILSEKDVFHLKGLSPDGITGYSVISMAKSAISIGMASDAFAASFYGNNTQLGMSIEHPAKLSAEAQERIVKQLKERHQGPNKAFQPFILEEGMKANPFKMPMSDAQYIESKKFTIEDVARFFGVPLHKIQHMDRSTFNNIESQNIEFVIDTLVPWIVSMEIEADIKLFGQSKGRLFTKMNANSLLRGDHKARAEYYRTMANLGVFSINEIRELEEMNPIGSDGDKRLVQLNQTTIDKIGMEEFLPTDNRSQTTTPPAKEEDKREELVNSAKTMIAHNLTKAVSLERRKAKSASAKCETREEFAEWVSDFVIDHSNYVVAELSAPVWVLCELLAGQQLEEKRNDYVELFMGQYFSTARKRCFDVYDGKDTLSRSELADDILDKFIGRFGVEISIARVKEYEEKTN